MKYVWLLFPYGAIEARMKIRVYAALACLPSEDVADGWLEIHSKSPDITKLASSISPEILANTW